MGFGVLASLTSTCSRHQVDPQLYLTQLLMNLPAWPARYLDAWLPNHWKLHHAARLATRSRAIEPASTSGFEQTPGILAPLPKPKRLTGADRGGIPHGQTPGRVPAALFTVR